MTASPETAFEVVADRQSAASTAPVPKKRKRGYYKRTRPQLLLRSELDGRTGAAKYFDRLVGAVESDLAGPDELSAVEKVLVEAFAGAAVSLQHLNAKLALGKEIDISEHSSCVGALVRVASRLGLRRRQRDVTQSWDDIAAEFMLLTARMAHRDAYPAQRVEGARDPEAIRAALRRRELGAVEGRHQGHVRRAARRRGELFRAVAERSPPDKPVREFAAVVGRGGGKYSVASVIAATLALNFDRRGKLRPGERAVVMLLAVDRPQAAIAFNYIAGLFREIPALRSKVVSVTDDTIELTNGTAIEVHTNSFRSVRGRSLLCVICDECSFWRSEDSSNPDREVVAAVQPGLGRIAGSMLILISSAHKRSGLLYDRWKQHYGRDDPDVLVIRGSTLQFNPTFDAKVIERALAEDRALFGAEYLSEWRDDLATFISRQLLEAAVDADVIVRPPIDGITYFAFDDPSGGARDSYTLAIAHQDPRSDNVILDLIFERFAPMNPYEVTNEIAALLKQYRCSQVTGDDYGHRWVTDAYGRIGINRIKSTLDRSGIYLNVLPLFTSGRARLLDNKRLVNQFANLERRSFPSGKDKIDHERGRHDDMCNAAAGALVLASPRRDFEPRIVQPVVFWGNARPTWENRG